MTVARDKSVLKRRLDAYFWHERPSEVSIFFKIYQKHFEEIGEAAIVGGLVRDFARAGRSAFRSDIDMVFMAPASTVAKVARRLGARKNRFGGYSYFEVPWKIDFWALESTWAARRGYVEVKTVEDVLNCTFFDWDAAAYSIRDRKIICKVNYLDNMLYRQMEINLIENPAIQGNLLRAIRRMLLWNLSAGPKLEYFICEHLDERSFQIIKETERKLYKNRSMDGWIDHMALLKNILYRRKMEDWLIKQLDLPLGDRSE